MKKVLRSKIEKMTREQLLQVLEQLCSISEVEAALKLVLSPAKNDIDRALQKFESCCESYISDSCSTRAQRRMYASAEPLYAALKFADDRTYAYIVYEMHQIVSNQDLNECNGGSDYYALVGDLIGDLSSILRRSPNLFSSEERKAYQSILNSDD